MPLQIKLKAIPPKGSIPRDKIRRVPLKRYRTVKPNPINRTHLAKALAEKLHFWQEELEQWEAEFGEEAITQIKEKVETWTST